MSTGYTKEERNSFGTRTLSECAEILTARGTPCTRANAFALEQSALGKLHRAFVNDPVLREIAEEMGMEVPETAASDVRKIMKQIRKGRA